MGGSNNLLLALRKYAHQQDENFTTEAFVHLLRHVQFFEPEIASILIGFLSGDRLKLPPEDCHTLQISTQNTFTEGRPDILIAGPACLLIIEVKVESVPGWDQLDRYRALLATRDEPNKCLVLLTRYPVDRNEEKKADECVRWDKTARILAQALKRARESTSGYLIRQFLDFLTERRMAMEKVDWELVRGVQSLMTLMIMLGEAVRAAKVDEKSQTAGIEYNGRYLSVDEAECWNGIYYAKPQLVVFEAYKIDKAKAEALGIGRVQRDSKQTYRWTNGLDLEAEDVHFFALSSDNQQLRLQQFVSDCIAAVKKIRAGN